MVVVASDDCKYKWTDAFKVDQTMSPKWNMTDANMQNKTRGSSEEWEIGRSKYCFTNAHQKCLTCNNSLYNKLKKTSLMYE